MLDKRQKRDFNYIYKQQDVVAVAAIWCVEHLGVKFIYLSDCRLSRRELRVLGQKNLKRTFQDETQFSEASDQAQLNSL